MVIAILWIAWHFRLNLIMVFHTLRTSFTFLYLPSFQVLLLFQTKEEEGRTREMTGSGAVLTRERGHCGASAGISVAVQWEHPQSSGTTTHRGAPHQPPQALSTPVLPHHHRKHCISQLLEKRKKEKKKSTTHLYHCGNQSSCLRYFLLRDTLLWPHCFFVFIIFYNVFHNACTEMAATWQ